MRAAARPASISSRSSDSSPWRSATTLCWWIVSRFSWRAETKLAPSSCGNASTTPAIISRTQSSTKRGRAVRLFDDLDLVGALHQLVDLRGHARLGDRQQRRRVDLRLAVLQAADLQRRQAALVVRRDRHPREDPVDLLRRRSRPSRGARGRARRPAPARTGRLSCPSPTRRRSAGCRARRRPRGRAACRSPASARPRRAPACARGSAPRSSPPRARRPGARGPARRCGGRASPRGSGELAEHDLADRLVDDLLEARHVRALLVAAQIDEAVEPREEQLVADAHHLLDARDAHAREPERDRRARAPGRRRRSPCVGDSVEIEPLACTSAKRSVRSQRPPADAQP